MKRIKQLVLACALASTTALAAAAPNPLSVHVLDLQSGQPAAGVDVTLEQHVGEQWRQLSTGATNAQGRIPALYPADKKMTAGEYRIVFNIGEYYARYGRATFFSRVPVQFSADATAEHYHIPLLLSPFGYSTYRGN
ncbi:MULTISPECIES: hydroxyisourate hydrolase [unclassified Janthinobacterium]|uniref:hydroxyisourate hydrolase n=1 Tax=unclassified Janthinobacterium TaxID=2610881 RepID=UPI00034661C9|nr:MULTISPECIES: hydroxyisourate hydrolase [unclassified Janthinobacterium]MEC5162361.1 5-hydroxyisourate hydrolase [Janthinobacterium sp. CG_S6]